jgi:hypothetical protein
MKFIIPLALLAVAFAQPTTSTPVPEKKLEGVFIQPIVHPQTYLD